MVPTVLDAVSTSLLASIPAVLLAALVAIPAAHGITGRSRKVQHWADTLATVPMVFPPTVLGFGLLWLLGSKGPLGRVTQDLFGVSVLFTLWAAILAAATVSFPLVYRSARTSFASTDTRLKEAARTYGLGEIGVFFRVSIPLARRGVLSGVLLGLARALGEFGATLMVAGNVPGETQTLPLAIFEAVQAGNEQLGLALCGVAGLVGFSILLFAERLEGAGAVG